VLIDSASCLLVRSGVQVSSAQKISVRPGEQRAEPCAGAGPR